MILSLDMSQHFIWGVVVFFFYYWLTYYVGISRLFRVQCPSLFEVLLSAVLVSYSQPWSKNIKWEILEISKEPWMCVVFSAAWSNLVHSTLPHRGGCIILLSRTSRCFCSLPISQEVAFLVIRSAIKVSQWLSSRDLCFTWSWPQSTRIVMLAIQVY